MAMHPKAALIIIISCLICLLGVGPVQAASEEKDEEVFSLQDTIGSLDMEFLDGYKKQLDSEMASYLEGNTVQDWISNFIKGEWDFDLKNLGGDLLRMLFKEVVANTSLLAKLLILTVISALLINLQSAFSSDVARISYLACFLALCAIAISSFKLVLGVGQETIENMLTFMIGMLPQMLVLTAGLGNINASVMLFPLLMTASTAFANAINIIVFPLILMSAILSIVNHMSETIKIDKMAKFFYEMARISLGFFLTLFVGLMTLRALYASVLDKVALRTTRYVSDNAIPVIGKMFSDTIEVAAGYVVMLKQALSIFGVLIILGLILMPLIKIAAIALIYKAASAIAEPLGDSRTASILESMSAHLFFMLAAVIAVALMFFIMIAIVAGMYNGWAMLK
ncbi:MAG: stage III sporulation protein AE [Syntrophomonadaceae bacterium]|jgi:stage III sporulation protein AE|nr:stage III sporulation protein AE [Syntrophomonadaceae bacterium]